MNKKIFIYIIILLITASCNVQNNRLVNTCWVLYKSSIYDPLKDEYIPQIPEVDNGGMIYHFKEKDVIINNTLETYYKLKKDKLNLSGRRFDIIEFSDTNMIMIDYFNEDKLDPYHKIYFKRIDCDTIEN